MIITYVGIPVLIVTQHYTILTGNSYPRNLSILSNDSCHRGRPHTRCIRSDDPVDDLEHTWTMEQNSDNNLVFLRNRFGHDPGLFF